MTGRGLASVESLLPLEAGGSCSTAARWFFGVDGIWSADEGRTGIGVVISLMTLLSQAWLSSPGDMDSKTDMAAYLLLWEQRLA